MGGLSTGVIPKTQRYNMSPVDLPAGLPSVDAWGLCSSNCLHKIMGKSEPSAVTKRRVVAAYMHMHLSATEGEVTVSQGLLVYR